MRAVFVNHCHPDTPHVCALRVTSFARAMAARGHQVVLLSETLKPNDKGYDIALLQSDLSKHDWATPFFLPVRPDNDVFLDRLRSERLPGGIRQLVIAGNYLMRSGVFGNWRNASKPYLTELSRYFTPDVVWASFGNTDVWNIANDLSKESGCPWVADVKDNWSAFLPFGSAKLIANRFHRASALTTFSKAHQAEAQRWFKQKSTVIYSGFDQVQVEPDVPDEGKRILVTGSLYDDESLRVLVNGISAWLQGREKHEPPVEVRYAGGNAERFRRLSLPMRDHSRVIIDDFLALERLRSLQAGAMVNVYIHSGRSLFQHKPIEIFAAGRPVLAIPGESREVLDIADQAGCRLGVCRTEEQVQDFLSEMDSNPVSIAPANVINDYSWQNQSCILEMVLSEAITSLRGKK